MILLEILHTAKSYSPKDQYSIRSISREFFKTLEEAKDFAERCYEGNKRLPVYLDDQSKTGLVGYVYCYRGEDEEEKWLQQDWIKFYTIAPIKLDSS